MKEAARRSPLPTAAKKLEVWGGVECTVNRIGDRYIDQIDLSGHASRADDLERFAALGIAAIRYPVLWERVAPSHPDDCDWEHTDRALTRLRELGLQPIVGLVHHGSGPAYTDLLDAEFATKLASFAGKVAARYPWIEMYTPVNEPLTTARFAALYGHWYPHARDDRSFVRAVLNQMTAIRASMKAIQSVNPDAQLIQTEDIGKTYSTPPLEYQAKFDNHRRWLTFDILTGRIDEWHPLWWYLLESGVERAELESFLEQPCVPSVLGLNNYLTSERFLDHRLELFTRDQIGGNGRHEYADVEAVRMLDAGIAGHETLLRETWQRYEIPTAITEVHLGCSREQQLRWLSEAWSAATRLRGEGVDVRAVTAWSLLGAYGWSSLLTKDFDRYEPGVFDLRSDPPRATALARMLESLAGTGSASHPTLDGPGWWRERSRLAYPPYGGLPSRASAQVVAPRRPARPVLIVGAAGTLGSAFKRVATARGLEVNAVTRSDLDICDPTAVRAHLRAAAPWAVINATGYVRVDDAELEPAACHRINGEAAGSLAIECADLGIPIVSFSSDLVFDGMKLRPYDEEDFVNPINVYGSTKAAAELTLGALPNTLTIRTSAFFGPWDSYNFLASAFRALRHEAPFAAANDVYISPTYVPDLVDNCLDLLIDGERGIWHLANEGTLTWAEFAVRAASAAGLDTALIRPVPAASLGLRALRPRYSALRSTRGRLMPTLEDAIARYVTDSRVVRSPSAAETTSNA